MKNQQFINIRFDLGDLVKIKPVYHLDYLEGEVGMIAEHYGCDPSDPTGEYYYEVMLANNSMILKHSELLIVSKAENKNNENR